jgi:hypothetical protein
MFVHMQWLRQQCVRRARTLAVVVALAFTASSQPLAQSAPNFEPAGLQPNRSYFGQLPFESVDMINGGVVLTFTDLALPGDAGHGPAADAHLQPSGSWDGSGTSGLPAVPLRVTRPVGDPNDCCDDPRS